MEQWYDEFAALRSDINKAVKVVAQAWEHLWPSPNDMHGMMHCTDVRGVMLRNRVGFKNPEKEPPAGKFRTRYGQGMSVVLGDGKGMRARVRKAPAEFFPELGDRLVIRAPKGQSLGEAPVSATDAKLLDQPALSAEMADLPRSAEKKYEWFVLWTLAPDGVQLGEVFLAAVTDIDSPSQVVIWASTPLPRKAIRKVPADLGVGDDFDEYGRDPGTTGTTDPA